MADVSIPISQDNATLLLAAAQELGLEPDVVRVADGEFLVDEKVAEKAELAAAKEDKPAAKKTAAKKTAAPENKE